MVLNLWKNTTPVCGNHIPDLKEMVFRQSGSALEFVCPECGNKISSADFEKILNSISKIYVTRTKNSDWGSIQGEKFVVSKVIKCEIISHTEDEKYTISVINPRAGVKK